MDLPHDWSIERLPGTENLFDPKCPSGSGGGFLPGGIGWYRKTFTLPPTAKGQRAFVEFEGVYMDSDVWLNGRHLGNHPYGYTSFQYELTPHLNWDGANVLAVRANVEQPCSRWYSGAGIYRHVWLTITDPVHVAHWGTYVTTPEVSPPRPRPCGLRPGSPTRPAAVQEVLLRDQRPRRQRAPRRPRREAKREVPAGGESNVRAVAAPCPHRTSGR